MALNTLINGNVYGWNQLKVTLFGRTVTGIQSIEYKVTPEPAPVMGAGPNPIAFGDGNETFEGSIELLMDEVEEIRKLVPTGRLRDIPPFPIIVSYAKNLGATRTTHRIWARFKDETGGMAQGESHKYHTYPLEVFNIEWKPAL